MSGAKTLLSCEMMARRYFVLPHRGIYPCTIPVPEMLNNTDPHTQSVENTLFQNRY